MDIDGSKEGKVKKKIKEGEDGYLESLNKKDVNVVLSEQKNWKKSKNFNSHKNSIENDYLNSMSHMNDVLDIADSYYEVSKDIISNGGYIYILISPIGKVYVGQTSCVKTRWREYLGLYNKVKPQRYLWSALVAYGPENFIYKIVDICNSQEELNVKEQYYMNLYNSRNREYGYNLKSGGAHGRHSEETKMLISKNMPDQSGKNNSFYGKKHTEKTKSHISNRKKGRILGPHSAEWNANISKSNKGRMPSEKNLKKLSKLFKGVPLSEERRELVRKGLEKWYRKKKWKWLYILIDPNGKNIYVKNLLRFCKSNNLSYSIFRKAFKNNKIAKNKWSISRVHLTSANNKLAIDVDIFPNYKGTTK
jgi:group I intron endonuclease